jgi:hypothetical protein
LRRVDIRHGRRRRSLRISAKGDQAFGPLPAKSSGLWAYPRFPEAEAEIILLSWALPRREA